MSEQSAWRATLVAAALFAAGCTSQWTTIAPKPPKDYEVLGRAEGEATGRMFFDGTVLNFIPIGLRSRTHLAYQAAVASVPGATGLINVTIEERWASWYIWSSKTVTITGDAIKERR